MVISGSSFDYDKLLQEAQIRWLKPSEVYFILKNHERYPIEPETPKKPPSGSLFLFNRRVHRFFRKDGHMWRKKKNGRAVGEAHERLKLAWQYFGVMGLDKVKWCCGINILMRSLKLLLKFEF